MRSPRECKKIPLFHEIICICCYCNKLSVFRFVPLDSYAPQTPDSTQLDPWKGLKAITKYLSSPFKPGVPGCWSMIPPGRTSHEDRSSRQPVPDPPTGIGRSPHPIGAHQRDLQLLVGHLGSERDTAANLDAFFLMGKLPVSQACLPCSLHAPKTPNKAFLSLKPPGLSTPSLVLAHGAFPAGIRTVYRVCPPGGQAYMTRGAACTAAHP
jgi:hypothetical protein